MAPTISVSEPQYTWQWQSSSRGRGHILAGALDELILHQVCFRDTKRLYSSITVVSGSWSHLQVRALQHGWNIIWETAGCAERAEPRPWETWEKKLCLACSYTGGRCHTSYEDFGIGFPGSKKKKKKRVIPKCQAERLGLSVTHSVKFNGNGFTGSWTRPLFQGVK